MHKILYTVVISLLSGVAMASELVEGKELNSVGTAPIVLTGTCTTVIAGTGTFAASDELRDRAAMNSASTGAIVITRTGAIVMTSTGAIAFTDTGTLALSNYPSPLRSINIDQNGDIVRPLNRGVFHDCLDLVYGIVGNVTINEGSEYAVVARLKAGNYQAGRKSSRYWDIRGEYKGKLPRLHYTPLPGLSMAFELSEDRKQLMLITDVTEPFTLESDQNYP